MNCPYCRRYFAKKKLAVEHIEKVHVSELEESNMDAYQALYFGTHHTLQGICMCGCGRSTNWNYKTGKPYKVRNDETCRNRLRTIAVSNHRKVYGTDTLLNDMNHQKEMISHRHTSGEYTFADGGQVLYTSKEDLNFLQFCDQVMGFTSNMIQEPPRSFPYFDKKANRMREYIPDYYLPDYNLIIEIKDGGDRTNTNPKFIEETKYKVFYKDEAMRKQTDYNYIRISGRQYGSFVEALYTITHEQGEEGPKTTAKKHIVITETASTDLDDIVDFSAPENFNELYLIVCIMRETDMVTAIGVCESLYLERFYVTNYLENTLREVYRDDDMFANCDILLYKYTGSSVNSILVSEVMRKIVYLATSDTDNVYPWDILTILTEYGIYYTSHMLKFTNNAHMQMDFIFLDKFCGYLKEGDSNA